MRMTLTIDDDIAVELKKRRRKQAASLKTVVNDALRRGLRDGDPNEKPRKPFRMKTFDGGQTLIPLDNIAEAIALIEGENYK